MFQWIGGIGVCICVYYHLVTHNMLSASGFWWLRDRGEEGLVNCAAYSFSAALLSHLVSEWG